MLVIKLIIVTEIDKQNKFIKSSFMHRSNKLPSHSLYSARLSHRGLNQLHNQNLSQSKDIKSKAQTPKIEFRKVLISRGSKHSRIKQELNDRSKQIASNRLSNESNLQNRSLPDHQDQLLSAVQSQLIHQKKQTNLSSFSNKLKQNDQKKSFLNKLQTVFKSQKNQKSITNSQEKNQDLPIKNRGASVLSSRSRKNLKLAQNDLQNQKQFKFKQDQIQTNRGIPEDQNKRPLSSTSKYSSMSKKRLEFQINEQQMAAYPYKFQNTAKVLSSKAEKQIKQYSLKQIVKHFNQIQQKINALTTEKWQLIEQKLKNEKLSTKNNPPLLSYQRNSESRMRNQQKKSSSDIYQRQSLPQKQKAQQKSLKLNQKFSFSKAVTEKNIDKQIMDQIKNLRNLNLNKQLLLTEQQKNSIKCSQIKEQLEERRSQIVEKALAQSMVESQLLRKYYSSQNYNALSTSNYKVGQQANSLKIKLQTTSKKLKQEKGIIKSSQQSKLISKDSVVRSSENHSKYIPHSEQDHQKYRYKHPNFKLNLQPLPRSAYKSEFLSYGNINTFYNPRKYEENIIFSGNYALKNSSYRNEFKQFNAERVNYKFLDAYNDKFKELDMMYMPKKRMDQQTKSVKNSKFSNAKLSNHLQFVKKLKTQSMLDDSKYKQLTSRITAKMFLSESRKQYENPENSLQKISKSQIKDKNLQNLKYNFKKKIHA